MTPKGVGVYPDKDGTILVSFQDGQKGVPLDRLLPKSVQGKNFAKFQVADYFALAQAVLATPEATEALAVQLKRQPPQKKNLPWLDSQALGWCAPNGDLVLSQCIPAFEVVAAYWENPTTMAVQMGFVTAALRQGLKSTEIIQRIRQYTIKDAKTGQLTLQLPKPDIAAELVSALIPKSVSLSTVSKAQFEQLAAWLSPIPPGALGVDSQSKITNLAFLGLVGFDRVVDRQAAAAAQAYIWPRLEDKPNFQTLWFHIKLAQGKFPAQSASQNYNAYNNKVSHLLAAGMPNTSLANEVLKMAKSGVPVPVNQLCGAAWIWFQLGRTGQYKPQYMALFNRETVPWLAAEAAEAVLSQIFSVSNARLDSLRDRGIGRNDPCPCGSGKKYKKCCGR